MKTLYRTEDGVYYESINAARIHEAIVSTGIYLEDYRLRNLAETLDKDYYLAVKLQQDRPLVKKEGE